MLHFARYTLMGVRACVRACVFLLTLTRNPTQGPEEEALAESAWQAWVTVSIVSFNYWESTKRTLRT